MSTLLQTAGNEFKRFRLTVTDQQKVYAALCGLKDTSEISRMGNGENVNLDTFLYRIDCGGGMIIIIPKIPYSAKPHKDLRQLLAGYTEEQILTVVLARRRKRKPTKRKKKNV